MSTPQAGAAADSFVPAQVAHIAPELDDGSIHLWWLPYRHSQGRAPLQVLLAAYLHTSPDALAWVENEHGKPRLALPHRLDFNWSHSGGHAMVAIAHNLPELGVDIEQHRPRLHALALAQRFFADSECALLAALPEPVRLNAFIHLWTAKEAVLKAHGHGLAYGLERVAFTLDGHVAKPLCFAGNIGPVEQWRFCPLFLLPNLSGMLAWRGFPRRLCRFRATVGG